MNQSPRFWNRIAERYSKKPIADEATYQKKLQVTRGYFTADMEILEFGCGTGSTAIAHAPYVKHIRAIDFSSKMIEIARGKAAVAGIGNVTFEESTIEEIELADNTIDAVLGLSILHLVEERQGVMEKVHRILKPGGIFVTSTPCLGDTMKWFGVVAPTGKFFGLIPLVRIFTREELENEMIGAGFELDYQWQPGERKAVFIVARKAA